MSPLRHPPRSRKGGLRGAMRLPRPERTLNSLYAGRAALALVAFAAMVWVWPDLAPAETLAISLIVLVAWVMSALSYAYTGILDRPASEGFRYGQMVFDCAFVTSIVILTGGAGSPFSPVYVLVIGAAAILLPLRGGFLIAVLAIVLYLAASVWGTEGTTEPAVYLHVALFTAVALATGYLGDRLRQAGAELGQVESELHKLRLDTDEILNTIGTGILTIDAEERLAYINPTGADLLGLHAPEWLGHRVLDELNQRAPGFGDLLRHSVRDRRPIARGEAGSASERGLLLGVSTTLMERGNHRDAGIAAIFQDISEKVRIDELRRRAERLEAVAELGASLAHEIKNPLASIRSAAEQLQQGVADVEDQVVLERLVLREADRLTRLLGDFLDFARVRTSSVRDVELNDLIRAVVTVVCTHPEVERCPIDIDIAEGERLVVPGDEDVLHRALLNLLLNAAQWAGEGGRVAIRADVTTTDVLTPNAGATEVVRLRILDTGPGFPPGIVERVFDPFFTAREGGSGLGLAIVERAVHAHGGAIIIDSPGAHPGWGGAVALYFPRRPAPVPAGLTEAEST